MIDQDSHSHKGAYTVLGYAIVIVGMLLLITGVCILLVGLFQ